MTKKKQATEPRIVGGQKDPVGVAGNAVREARTRANLTSSQLGNLAGISKSQISAIERGRANVTLGSLERIAAALNGVLVIRIEVSA